MFEVDELDLPGVVAELHTARCSQRSRLIDRLLGFCEDAEEPVYTKYCLHTAFVTAHYWTDYPSQRLIEQLLATVAANSSKPGFIDAFIKRFSAYCQPILDSEHASGRREVLKLVRWSTAVILANSKEDGILAPLILVQCRLLDQLLDQSSFHTHITNLFFKKVFVLRPSLVEVYVNIVIKNNKPLHYATNLLVTFARLPKRSEEIDKVWTSARNGFLQHYLNDIVNSAQPLPRSVLNAWDPFTAGFTHEEMKSVVSDVARLLKRSPELIGGPLLALVENAKLDLSRYNDAIFPSLIVELRHNDDDRRNVAVAIIRALAAKTSDPAVLEHMQDELGLNLLGKKEGLPTYLLRISFLNAYSALTAGTSAGSEALKQNALNAISTLVEYLDIESHIEAKRVGVSILGKWIQVNGGCPSAATTHIITGLIGTKKKDGSTFAYLQIARQLLGFRLFEAALAKASPDLIAHIKAAVAAPKNRLTGLLSTDLLIASPIKGSQGNDKALIQSLQPLTEMKSFINDPELIAKGSEDDLDAHVQLFSTVIKNTTLLPDQFDLSRFLQGILYLLFTAVPTASRQVFAAIEAALILEPQLVFQFIPAFYAILFDNGFAAFAASPFIFTRLLLRLSTNLPNEHLTTVTLIAHHPALRVVASRPSEAWNKLAKQWKRGEPEVETSLTECVGAWSTFITSNAGLLSSSESRQSTAVGLLATISAQYPDFLPQILPSVVALMNPAGLTVSDYHKAVFETPEGELCKWVDESKYIPKAVENKNVKRGKHQLYSAEDEKWEQEVAKAKKVEKEKVDPEIQAKLLEEQKIRENLKGLVHRFHKACQALEQLAQLVPNAVRLHILSQVLEPLCALMKVPLVSQTACGAHLALANALDKNIHSFSTDLAVSVQLAVKQDVNLFTNEFALDTLSKTLEKMSVAIEKEPVGAASFEFVLPLIRLLILNSTDSDESESKGGERKDNGGNLQPGMEASFQILAAHCKSTVVASSSTRFPCQSMVLLLLHTIAHINALQMSAQEALGEISLALRAKEADCMLADNGALSKSEDVRLSVLRSLRVVPELKAGEHSALLVSRLWLLTNDEVEAVSAEADNIWDELKMELHKDYHILLLPLLSHPYAHVRIGTGRAIAAGCSEFPDTTAAAVAKLIEMFRKNVDVVTFSIRPDRDVSDRHLCRSAVARALGACKDSLDDDDLLSQIFVFFLSHGLADMNNEVWESILASGVMLLEDHGAKHMDTLLPLFERNMIKLDNAGLTELQGDRVYEGIVVFMGTLASHMSPENEKIVSIVDHLIAALKTPSAEVQKSVAERLSPLMGLAALEPHTERLVKGCLEQLAKGETFAERKGAAFGLAAMIKGLKLSSLKKYDVLAVLSTYVQDGKAPKAREGALMAYERLFAALGNKFEPYVDNILPLLLASFSDANADVRLAASEASQTIMANLTGYGVQRALPRVLGGLDDKAWKTKVEAISLLGAMAYCAPRQLSSCLPQVVPKLLEAMTDPHAKIQEATRKALSQIGSVIRNPEIRKLVPKLLSALNDPAEQTKEALSDLMKTSFVHSVDPASLALIVPILQRGLRDRSSQIKKMAAQVVGSMCSLIADVKDILPYAEKLLHYLKVIIVDPIPEVRAVAARSLGALFKGLGEEHCGDLVAFLLGMLDGETSSVQRSGAAMSLAQVMKTIGTERTLEILPTIYEKSRKATSGLVREGYMGVFQFLPDTFGTEFATFLPAVFPVVIEGLSDDIGPVREVALKAGQALVIKFARTETDLLLPPLEEGLRAESWRIRLSSVQLLGSLLLRLAGASGTLFVGDGLEGEDEDKKDAGVVTLAQELLVEDLLGTERRNEVFATIYLMRSDSMSTVRQMSWRVWKGIASNTPRMLAQVLPTLMRTIIADLASTIEERQAAATAALGDLVQKMGDTVLQQIVPIMQRMLQSPEPATREGVCLGLSEIMRSAKKVHITAYMQDLVPAVKDALCDPEESVRKGAGRAFHTLFRNIGQRAIDDVLPTLLARLDIDAEGEEGDEGEIDQEEKLADAQLVVEGLRQILAVCHKETLPHLLPELTKSPMSVFHMQALASLSDSFGHSFHKYVGSVTESLVEALSTVNEAEYEPMREAASAAILCVTQDSVHTLLDLLNDKLRDPNPRVRTAAAQLMGAFISKTSCNYDTAIMLVLKGLLSLYVDQGEEVQKAAMGALTVVTEAVDKDELTRHISAVRQVIHDLCHDRKGKQTMATLPGLCQKGGLGPLLPIYQHGLMNGSAVIREQSATGLGELVILTSQEALSSFVVKITGPLIRIVGDRFPSSVKTAILNTLGLLIGKSGVLLKAFLPQLQTTFIKALGDLEESVRTKGGRALVDLMVLSRRVDPVVTELVNSVKTGADLGVQTSMLQSLTAILADAEVSTKLSSPVMGAAATTLLTSLDGDNDVARRTAAEALGACMIHAPEHKTDLLQELLLDSLDWKQRDGQAAALASFFVRAPQALVDEKEELPRVRKFALERLSDDNAQVKTSGVYLAFALISFSGKTGNSKDTLLDALLRAASDSVVTVRRSVFSRLRSLSLSYPSILPLPTVVPVCLSKLEDPDIATRNQSALVLRGVFKLSAGPQELDAFCKSISVADGKRLKDSLKAQDWKALEEGEKEAEVVIRV